jgi:hypothetical protein
VLASRRRLYRERDAIRNPRSNAAREATRPERGRAIAKSGDGTDPGLSVGMETIQRHPIPMIPPWPSTWPIQRKIGFGFVAIIPLALLALTFMGFLLSTIGTPFAQEALAVLFYTHVGSQFITLLVFGHLMVGNPALSPNAKMMWGFAFLFLAPFAIVAYWVMHVMRATAVPGQTADDLPGRHVHVYDYDYTDPQPRGTQRREDGVLIHHIDMTTA